jgi:hypothetical protein
MIGFINNYCCHDPDDLQQMYDFANISLAAKYRSYAQVLRLLQITNV